MRLRKMVAAAGLVLMGGAAFAQNQPIPQDMLDLDYQRCMKDCEPGFGAATCKPLCECTVGEFKKRLDFPSYLELSAQLSRNELTEENRNMLDGIANMCTAKLEKSGVKVGDGTTDH
ncbi:hypothetical protein [Kordiimonas gwangyangensis]|uniref:hypothetical protein n=1 Tax=Kordiimonas gwangyangensis TaxID=288022 RepID=UPI0003A36937|nr:hypothetical protein [Kordiimonas gwangyangensis]